MRIIKKIISSIWNEFVYGGHLLSLGAMSIVYTSSVLLNIKITWDFLVIAYLGTYTPYLYNRYREFNKDFLTNPERTKHIEKYVKYIPIIISFFVLVIIVIFLYFNKILALLFALFLLLFSFLYSKYFKEFTKKIFGFKDFFVSLFWSLIVILLAIYYSSPLNLALFLMLIFVFLRWVINTSTFDIKDIENDKRDNLITFAIFLGKRRLIYTLWLLNILSFIPIILGFYLNLYPISSLILLFTIPYAFYFLKKVEKLENGSDFLYNVIIDGEFILWTIFIRMGKFLIW